MTKDSTVVVLGTANISDSQRDMFRLFGETLQELGKHLVTTPTPGVPAAVAEGFRATGKQPTMLTGELPNHDRVIVFCDNEFRHRLDDKVPDWDERNWIVLTGPDAWEQWYEKFLIVAGEIISLGRSGDGDSVGQGRRPRRPRSHPRK